LRTWLYKVGILRAAHLGCLVIVVGNLSVGGTGKTPVVERLARSLHARGRRVAILSRGYKSKKEPLHRRLLRWFTKGEPLPPRIVSEGQGPLLPASVAGDEPYMLARNLPGVLVLTDKDRVKAGRYAIRHFGVDTLILDDGYQYYRMKDHVQLLLIDQSNPFGNGRLLPRGVLREPVGHMARASYVVLTKAEGPPQPDLLRRIRRYHPEKELISCRHAPQRLEPVVAGGESLPLEALAGKRVAALSGIAVPESFEAFLEGLGATIVHRARYLDHHSFSREDLTSFQEAARQAGADLLLTTEKDAVRIPADWVDGQPFLFLRVEIRIVQGAGDFEEAVTRICFPRQEMRATRAPFPAR
jgi:tetraacyldisaccharide 4'-kinase